MGGFRQRSSPQGCSRRSERQDPRWIQPGNPCEAPRGHQLWHGHGGGRPQSQVLTRMNPHVRKTSPQRRQDAKAPTSCFTTETRVVRKNRKLQTPLVFSTTYGR